MRGVLAIAGQVLRGGGVVRVDREIIVIGVVPIHFDLIKKVIIITKILTYFNMKLNKE